MFDLRTYLPYLLNRVGFVVTDHFGERLAKESLTVPMWRVLAVLWHDGVQRIGDLAELTAIEISTLSRLVGTLQRNGLVARKRAGNDGRVVNVGLTERGRHLTERLLPDAIDLENQMVAGLSPADVAELRRLLDALYANVRASAAQSNAARSA